MIKIFTPEKTIYLTDNQSIYKKGIIFLTINSKEDMMKKYADLMDNPTNSDACYFYNKNIQVLLEYFSSLFKIIEAAGGLVKNKENEWLFIFRNGKWDLPKGKIEKGEAIKEAAIREVEEECGISGLKITKTLDVTYHTYSMEGKNILKKTYWFEMQTDYKSALTPQIEEGITDVKWINTDALEPILDNTYDSIKEVMKEIKRQ